MTQPLTHWSETLALTCRRLFLRNYEVRINIGVHDFEKHGPQRVRLNVADSGGGFPPHILQRAFEPYVTTKARGTGLGLAVVKKIADEHAARIDLANRSEGAVVQGAQVSLSFAPEPTVAP